MNATSKWLAAGIISKFLHSRVWHLGGDDLKVAINWKCQPEHLHMASLCGLGLSQHSSWITSGRIWRSSRWKLRGLFWHGLLSEIMKQSSLLLHSVGMSESLRLAHTQGMVLVATSWWRTGKVTLRKSMWESKYCLSFCGQWNTVYYHKGMYVCVCINNHLFSYLKIWERNSIGI